MKKKPIRIDELEVENQEEQVEQEVPKPKEAQAWKKTKDIPKEEALWVIRSRICNWCAEKYPWQDCMNCTLRQAMNDIATYEKPRALGCYVPMKGEQNE